MDFTGDPIQRIDGKGRFLLPAKMRDVLDHGSGGRNAEGGSTAILHWGDFRYGGSDHHLRLYSQESWQQVLKVLNSVPEGTEEFFDLTLFYAMSSQEIISDREGRFVLPARIRDLLGVQEGEILLAGARSYIEIWRPEVFDEVRLARFRARAATRPAGFDPIVYAARPRES